MADTRDTSYGRMCRVPSPQITARTSGASLKQSAALRTKPFLFLDLRNGSTPARSWRTDIPSHGEPSMRSIGESPSVVVESTLSSILEANAPEKYYLSAKACKGILRRAERRGKELPLMLKEALEQMIERDRTTA